MKNQSFALCLAVTTLLAPTAFAQGDALQGQGKAVVTVLPKKDGAAPPSITGQDMSIKVEGRPARVTSWKSLQSPENAIELVLLIDGSARSSLGTQFQSIEGFVKSLPPNIKAAIAYMQNGRAVFAGGFTTDHAQVLRGLHLSNGSAGSSASPYFCLSDLAKNWPSSEKAARREVVMVTDGIDPYHPEYDPEDPYLQAAINDSVRAGLVVYSIYWQGKGGASNSSYETNAGQGLLNEVAQATGGKSYWMGMGNPVSFDPYFDELTRRFRNQYELGFTTGLTGKPKIEELKLKFSAPGAEVDAPGQVMVYPAAPAQN
ncbi:MAG: hypothetical protein ABR991_13500 [Terracidiphilus sp.]|jgi:hypothetical protein